MSFAEEPIKASKPFITNGSTNGPLDKYNVTEPQAPKSDNNLNLIPTSAPTKLKFDMAISEPAQETNTSGYTLTPLVLTNSTPPEESHEIFNSDKDGDAFQNTGVVKKSVKTETVENVPNSLKSIVSKSSESEEEAALSERTYNIEGTFDSNDFANGAEPINVYKKIDLNPLETKEPPQTDAYRSSESTTPSFTFQSTSRITLEERPVTTVPKYNSSETSTRSFSTDLPTNQTATSSQTSEKPLRKPSPLLSGYLEDESSPNRKRRVVNTDRHSSYPYFLGRILG